MLGNQFIDYLIIMHASIATKVQTGHEIMMIMRGERRLTQNKPGITFSAIDQTTLCLAPLDSNSLLEPSRTLAPVGTSSVGLKSKSACPLLGFLLVLPES